MKKLLLTLLLLAVLIPSTVFAALTPVSVMRDTVAGFIRPLSMTDFVKSSYFIATSTTASSTFTNGFETPSARALTSAGLGIYAGNSTLIGLLGAGNTANVAWYGSHTMAGNLIVDTNTLYVNSTTDNVSIGTTTGTAKLTVQGTTGSANNILTISSSTSPFYQILSNGNQRWGTVANGVGEKYAFDGSIRIAANTSSISTGAGTTPNGIWSFGTTDFIFTPDNGGTGNTFYMKGATGSFGIGTSTPISTLAVTGYAGVNPVAIASSTGLQLFNILQNGNVGIGSSSPSEKLTVASGNIFLSGEYGLKWGGGSQLYEQTVAVSGVDRMIYRPNGDRFDVITENGSQFMAGFNLYEVSLYTSGSQRLVIDSTGKVGIGSSTPASTLGIKGTAGITPFIVASSTNATLLTVLQNGNTGIGLSNPSYRFETSGTSNIANRTWAINTVPVMFLPDQTSGQFLGSLYVGNGGRSATAGAQTNTSVGIGAALSVTSGSENTAVGYYAGSAITTGIRSVYIGTYAGALVSTGGENLYMGYASGYNTTSGGANTAIGGSSLRYNQAGGGNVAIGFTALSTGGAVADVYNTIGIGYSSGFYTTGISYGVYIGMFSGYANTTGQANTILGSYTGYNNQTGNYNTYVGFESGYGVASNSQTANSAVGKYSLFSVTTGSYNSILGTDAGFNVTSGSSNIFLGYQAGYTTTSGNGNILLGYAINAPTAGTSNFMSLGNLIFSTGVDGTGTTLSSGNVGIGISSSISGKLHVVAGANTTYGTFDAPTSGYAYHTYKYNGTTIGYLGQGNGLVGGGSATDFGWRAENNLIFAAGGVNERMKITSTGNVGIGSSTPVFKLSVAGTIGATGLTTAAGTPNSVCQNAATGEFTINAALTCTVSDEDQKSPLEKLSFSALDMIMEIQPSSFNYNDFPNRLRYGFGAQSLQKIDPRLGDAYDENGIARSIDMPAILAVTVKAVQELNDKIEAIDPIGAKKAAQDNWQWVVIGLLAIGYINQQRQINKLKK